MAQEAKFTLYRADYCGNEYNTSYPHSADIHCADDLKRAVAFDHVAALYGTGYLKKDTERKNPIPYHRSNDDFIESDCLMLDCDNTESDDPADWITPERIKADFSGIAHYIVTSRNHMKPKDGKTPRPKFHVYFPIDMITDVKKYRAYKDSLISKYPYFDFNAKDGARYFFGNPDAEVTYVDGGIIVPEKETQKPPGKFKKNIIYQGERNTTLTRRAGQLLKRYGDTEMTRRRYDEVCERCEPRLDKTEENTIYLSAKQFFHNVIMKSPSYKSPDDFDAPSFAVPTDNGYVISPPLLADYYLEHHTVIIVTDSGTPRIYEYDGGVYKYHTELEVKAVLGSYITAFRRGLWQSGKIAEAYTAIIHTAELYVTQRQLNANPDVVCIKNGLLNLREWKLYPHRQDEYYTTQLDCCYDVNIPETPVFDGTLYVYSEGSKTKMQFMMQYIGAVFSNVPGYKFKRFLLTIGEKDSGKTILKRLTEILVGEGNYNNCDLADLENNRFAAASLHLKRLSGTNDLRAAKIPEVGRLLQLTGGDSMRVERKGEQDFSMIYTGYIWHVGNNKPIYGGKQNEALYLRGHRTDTNRR